MNDAQKLVMAVNVGSSSVKSVLYSADNLKELVACDVEGIGGDDGEVFVTADGHTLSQPTKVGNHTEALHHILDAYTLKLSSGELVGIGHRIVFTGELDSETRPIDDEYVENLRQLIEVDPDHAPYVIEAIEELRQRFNDVPHIASSDSAFFVDLPLEASMIALPRKYYERGIKKYGYHGLSYSYLMSEIASKHGELASKKLVLAHLGSGCSLVAVDGGKPVDTTMSFSPTSGVPMSARSGDLDPSIITYLMQRDGLSLVDINRITNHESGLLGVSGTSADMLTLLNEEDSNPQAAEAISLFCYRVAKAIGALATAMDGLDGLVFTAGIGERSAPVRQKICSRLSHLGVSLDETGNNESREVISTPDSTGVYVLPTNEEIVIARQAIEVIKQQTKS